MQICPSKHESARVSLHQCCLLTHRGLITPLRARMGRGTAPVTPCTHQGSKQQRTQEPRHLLLNSQTEDQSGHKHTASASAACGSHDYCTDTVYIHHTPVPNSPNHRDQVHQFCHQSNMNNSWPLKKPPSSSLLPGERHRTELPCK